ncbi:hypothetical protein FZC78_16135 [Rossellomorea vietnamensis]|uniref:DUF8042 domain-containing protein n=1 Tax=Rossellomorea vietnamensis TaxID=218284 RepID=A0A5D4NLK4_9BACI|nr:hypothetical protein [Rossellomorea vietnamensis]TYS15183.1 hypothetical protein FZC78_16135 [Rossellomorea vietnamensis]
MTNKVILDETQHTFVGEYSEMLSTIEEAFHYVIASFEDYEKTEGDTILTDIFQALAQIAESNTLLKSLFTDQPLITAAINQYEEVTNEAMKLDGSFADQNLKETVIKENLYPAFAAWHGEVRRELDPYTNS